MIVFVFVTDDFFFFDFCVCLILFILGWLIDFVSEQTDNLCVSDFRICLIFLLCLSLFHCEVWFFYLNQYLMP